MSASFNSSSNSYQKDIETMKECIVYLDRSSYDINVNMERISSYIDRMPTKEKQNALRGDINGMRPTATRLLSDISTLTSEYNKILAEKQMNQTLEDKMIKLNNRLMDVHGRKRELFDNIIKTLVKYNIKYTHESRKMEKVPILEETEDDIKKESSGGRRRYKKHTLRKKRGLRKRTLRSLRSRRNRA